MANVSIRELAIGFGSVGVLKSLNLEVRSGEFIVLLGDSVGIACFIGGAGIRRRLLGDLADVVARNGDARVDLLK